MPSSAFYESRQQRPAHLEQHLCSSMRLQSIRGVPDRKIRPVRPKHGNQAHRDNEVIGHGVRPARRIGQVLAHPQQQNRRDDGKLAGNDQKRVSPVRAVCPAPPPGRGSGCALQGEEGNSPSISPAGTLGLRPWPLTVLIQSHAARAAPQRARGTFHRLSTTRSEKPGIAAM